MTNRIEPAQPPYDEDVRRRLEAMMPRGVPPILLFRTFVKNIAMTEAMGTWGSYELSKGLSLSRRDREILIDRTCARCGCEYEWGVHMAFFADRVGLTRADQLVEPRCAERSLLVQSERSSSYRNSRLLARQLSYFERVMGTLVPGAD